jgi:hypothetical protein
VDSVIGFEPEDQARYAGKDVFKIWGEQDSAVISAS